MKNIILDGNKMTSKKETHIYLKEMMNLPNYYGHNLDALWDILTSTCYKQNISLINTHNLINHLNKYGENLIKVFKEASDENKNIIFHNE
ncbi:MAG: barstar family protein [Bacillota bacterium]|nr:barstar family protein [Bacillota bacterium]